MRFAHAEPLPPDTAAGTRVLAGRPTGAALGAAVANVGDADGDGREDLLVGAPGAREAQLLAGGRYAPVLRGRRDRKEVAAAGDSTATATATC